MHAHTHKVHFSFYKTFIHTKFVQSEKKTIFENLTKRKTSKKNPMKKEDLK